MTQPNPVYVSKLYAVYASVKTLEQLEVANKYCDLWLALNKRMGVHPNDLLRLEELAIRFKVWAKNRASM